MQKESTRHCCGCFSVKKRSKNLFAVKENLGSEIKRSEREIIGCGKDPFMDNRTQDIYIKILERELVPAMGCTEPIAIALTAAKAKEYLIGPVERVSVSASGNIIKNVKSVKVPGTGGLRGIGAAVAAGVVAGDPHRELEVLAGILPKQQAEIRAFLENTVITLSEALTDHVLDIGIRLENSEHEVYVRTVDRHTGICLIRVDNKTVYSCEIDQINTKREDPLTIRQILEFAQEVDLSLVKEILDRQIAYNTAIAKEGLSGKYGAAIGKTLLDAYGDGVWNRAKAFAAAGSDARMNGCELPVVINSGSGNQGMTASLPVIVYAEELGVSKEKLYRALLISNLTTIHLKTGIGCLSAYCGAISAGCGAAAGVMYLYGGGWDEIAHTVVNGLAINSGVVCDGAKASCAAKIASAVESGLLGMQMYLNKKEFYSGDGLVGSSVEDTIRNVGKLAQNGMVETDREIIRIMLNEESE